MISVVATKFIRASLPPNRSFSKHTLVCMFVCVCCESRSCTTHGGRHVCVTIVKRLVDRSHAFPAMMNYVCVNVSLLSFR